MQGERLSLPIGGQYSPPPTSHTHRNLKFGKLFKIPCCSCCSWVDLVPSRQGHICSFPSFHSLSVCIHIKKAQADPGITLTLSSCYRKVLNLEQLQGNAMPEISGGRLSRVDSDQPVPSPFSLSRNSIAASAVCVFNLSAISQAFNGPFKYQENSRSAWLPYPNPNPNFQVISGERASRVPSSKGEETQHSLVSPSN